MLNKGKLGEFARRPEIKRRYASVVKILRGRGSCRSWTIIFHGAAAAAASSTDPASCSHEPLAHSFGISQELCHFTHPREKSFVQHPLKACRQTCSVCGVTGTQTLSLSPNDNRSTLARLIIQMSAFNFPVLN